MEAKETLVAIRRLLKQGDVSITSRLLAVEVLLDSKLGNIKMPALIAKVPKENVTEVKAAIFTAFLESAPKLSKVAVSPDSGKRGPGRPPGTRGPYKKRKPKTGIPPPPPQV